MQQKTFLFLVLTGVYIFVQRVTSGANVVPVQDLVWTQKNQHRLLMQHDINSGADSGLVSTVRLIVMAPGMAYKLRACSRIDRTANLMCKALVDVIDERGGVMRVREIAGIPDGPMDPLDIARMILRSLPPELRALFYLHVKALRHCIYHDDMTDIEFTAYESFEVQTTQLDVYQEDSVFTEQNIATLAMRQDASVRAAAGNGSMDCPFESVDRRCVCPKVKGCTSTDIRWSPELIRSASSARYMLLFPRPNYDVFHSENHPTNQPSKCRVSPYLQMLDYKRNTLRNWRLYGMIGKKFVKSAIKDGAYESYTTAGKEHRRVREGDCTSETLSHTHCYGILYFARGFEEPSNTKPYRGVAKVREVKQWRINDMY